MTLVTEILDWTALLDHVARKEVTMREHPHYPNLAIFNYTDITAINSIWTPETLQARGLIVDLATNEVIARPFAKFFNYGQKEAPSIDMDAMLYWVDNKYDGSLGIVYYNEYSGMFEVATRGSFASDQAQHASDWLTNHANTELFDTLVDLVEDGYTPLVEIIYPENRIVVDYGTEDYLALLGAVNIELGNFIPPSEGPVKAHQTLREAWADTKRKNAEGWVCWLDPFTAVKVKQMDYIELHRIFTGLSRKSVWRVLSTGRNEYLEMLSKLPDELYSWAEGVANDLNREYALEMREIDGCYISILEQYEDIDGDEDVVDRALFARLVKAYVEPKYQGYMFSLLDGRDIQTAIWRSIEPKGSR